MLTTPSCITPNDVALDDRPNVIVGVTLPVTATEALVKIGTAIYPSLLFESWISITYWLVDDEAVEGLVAVIPFIVTVAPEDTATGTVIATSVKVYPAKLESDAPAVTVTAVAAVPFTVTVAMVPATAENAVVASPPPIVDPV